MIIKNIRPAISPICNMHCKYCSNVPGSGQYAKMEDFRRTPISSGVLTTNQWLKMFECFYDAGFRGISLTGGEPTLNPDWIKMLKHCKELGYINTELTSNLATLEKYKKELADVRHITKFKVSLDTFNKERFNHFTGSNLFDQVLSNIIFLKSRGFNVQLNRVSMRSTLEELADYIRKANNLKANVNLLDLVYYKNSNSHNDYLTWKKEFISAEETYKFLEENLEGMGQFESDSRYGFKTSYGDISIILKDSRLTKRAEKCFGCPLFCQEGIFTVRIASDGTISSCPDYRGELSYIPGIKALEDDTLTERITPLFKEMETNEQDYFGEYLRRLENAV